MFVRGRIRAVASMGLLGLVAALVGGLTAASSAALPATGVGPTGFVRVDSVGYLPGDVKHAYVMTTAPAANLGFTVLDQYGHVAIRGHVDAGSRGAWNKSYPDVYSLAFSRLVRPGRYRVAVSGDVRAVSATFVIEDARNLYGMLVRDGVAFFQAQRDGADQVAGPLARQPSHLNDAHAGVYEVPTFVDSSSDTIANSTLTPLPGGGLVNAAGGWFDAGDFLKFTHTTAYGDVVLYASARALGSAAPATLLAEARHGESWLNDMWNQRTKTLYLQVGIGSGNSAGTFFGDHDLWRLPQVDDHDNAVADRFAAAHRPVFEAARPGALISPNLVGRVSAAFALAAQFDAHIHPALAAQEFRAATSLYARADTAHPPNPLVTTWPNSYYPETTWRDDMELGAAEIALAAQDLGWNARPYLRAAAGWAAAYMATETGDTFNLYDTSALAHADLIEAIRRAGSPSGLGITTGALTGDLRRQIEVGVAHATADVFRAAGDATNFDVDAHTFGWIAMVGMYDHATGDHRFDDFAADQRGWLFGANAWGASFMVGEGTNFPSCMQHQVANLSGSLDRSAPLVVGAVVNGPNSPSQFAGGLGGLQSGMRKCPASADPYRQFSGHGSRYVDDVRAWQTDEPALDMTGAGIIAAAYQEAYG